MASIDRFVQHLLRVDAQTLTLSSNGPVVAKLASGVEKTSTQTVDHAMLVATINEVAPPAALNDLRLSKPTRFVHPVDAPVVNIEVQPFPGAWKAVLSPFRRGGTMDRLAPQGGPKTSPSPSAPIASARVSPPQEAAPAPHTSVAPARPTEPTPPQRPSLDGLKAFSLPPVGPLPGLAEPRPSAPVAEAPVVIPVVIPVAPPAPRVPDPATMKVAPIVGEVPSGALDRGAIDRLLRIMTEVGASDLHLGAGRVPMMRLHGEIKPLPGDHAVLTSDALRALLLPTMTDATRREYAERNDADYAYEIDGVARFRGNAFVDRRGCCGVFRRIPVDIVSAEQLGISRAVLDLCNLSKGLVLVTGPTGSGKSTTLAALVDRINATRRDHIITIEDPIEFVHKNNRCLVNQREVKVHTDGFKDALRAALREDPDVVLVGEMRDLETVAIAIETAETGHLVFGTLHTRTAPSTVDRIIDQFPAERQPQIRTMLSESLKAVISQTLCKKVGGGRVAAHEVLLVTPAVSNLIREGKTFLIHGVMQTSRQLGMQTLNDALADLVRTGRIDVREAWARTLNKSELRSLFQQHGIAIPRELTVKEA